MKRTKKAKNDLNLTPATRNNKTALNAHFVNVLAMEALILLQSLDHKSTWGYFLVTAFLAFVPLLIEFIIYKKNSESKSLRFLIAIGFMLYYGFLLFTSANQLTFVFVITMLLVLSVYNDVRLSTLFSTLIFAENLTVVFLGSAGKLPGYLGLDYGIIQIMFLMLIGTYSTKTNQTLQTNFKSVFDNLSVLASEMKNGINDINEELVKLSDASATTANAMQEVTTGTNDTAEAVQSQLLQTQEIQNKVDLVSDSTNQITDHMQETLSVLTEGNQNVSLLVEKVDASVQSGIAVEEKLHVLEQSVTEMNSVVEFISRIAREIGLLSLNARIEASHAGDAGKGFAVVASEIAEMANQTKEATTSIASLIEHTSSGITETVAVIHQMLDGIREEKVSTDNTAASFTAIQESTLSIRDNVDVLTRHIEDLKEANSLIAESVQTISAVSEQVSAHAAETASAEEENATILAKIDTRMQELLDVVNR